MDPNHYILDLLASAKTRYNCNTNANLGKFEPHGTLSQQNVCRHRYTWEDIPNGTYINYDLPSCYWVEHRDTAVGRYGVNADVGG